MCVNSLNVYVTLLIVVTEYNASVIVTILKMIWNMCFFFELRHIPLFQKTRLSATLQPKNWRDESSETGNFNSLQGYYFA